MSGFSTNAILLKKIEYGDHDFIISFLTRSNGKISVIAKNAKQSIKRFSGAFDLFCMYNINCTYPKKKKDGLIILAQTDLEQGFVNIRSDIFKTAYASFWVELVHLWLEEGRVQTDLYDLLEFSLGAINEDTISREILSLLFQIRFMSISGFSPNIEHCGKCGILLDQIKQKNVRFDFSEGRIICQNCINKRSNAPENRLILCFAFLAITEILPLDRVKKLMIKSWSPYSIFFSKMAFVLNPDME
jgi:DNA repair protein RecO (recombination protein O)